jgi:AraC family transcriptional regulator
LRFDGVLVLLRIMFGVLSRQSMLDSFDGTRSRQVATFLDAKVEVTVNKILEDRGTELMHFHENAHLAFILNGGVVDKRQKSETEIVSGDLVFFHAGEPHQTIYKCFPEVNLCFELDEGLLADKSFGEKFQIESLSKSANTKFTALKIYKEFAIQDEFSDTSIETLILNLLSGETETKNERPKWVEKVIELLNDSWNEPLSLNDLAVAANVYPTTISKHFPKYVSCTLGEYRRRLKIEKSLNFIKTSHQSLTEIAYQCGFADQSHFTRTFKQLTGFLPRQYETL